VFGHALKEVMLPLEPCPVRVVNETSFRLSNASNSWMTLNFLIKCIYFRTVGSVKLLKFVKILK